jgi:HEAT repeat protein
LLALLSCVLCAFSWPGRTQRLVTELRAAEDPRARSDMARLLGAVGDATAHEALLEATRDRDAGVRAAALRALAQLNDAPLDVTREAVVALLSDAAPVVRAAAASALSKLTAADGDDAVALLLRSLTDEDPKVRAESARALGKLRAGRAVAGLGQALSDASIEVATAAAHALANEAGAQALALLANKLAQAPLELRLAILDALNVGSAEAARNLALLALSDENVEVVLSGLRLVLRHQLSAALQQVERLAQVDDARLASAARLAAEALRAEREERAQGWQSDRPAWLEPLLRAGDPDLPADQTGEVLTALEATLPAHEPMAAEPLAEWLLRAPSAARARIAALLASTGQPARASALIALLPKSDAALQMALCDVLAHTRDARYAPALLPLLRAENPELRAAAARALGAIADAAALDRLRDTLVDGPPRARESAAYALALALEVLLAGGPTGVARVHTELGRRRAKRLRRALLAALLDGDEATGARTARALGVLDAYAATRALAQHADKLSPARRIALLRAGVGDGSDSARALRAHYAQSPQASLAATAFTAQVLSGELATRELLQVVARARWPLGPIAAFALARTVAKRTQAVDATQLCDAWKRSAEPTARRNLRVALEGLRATCGDFGREGALARASGAARTNAFRSLVFVDGSVLISFPDAAHDPSWRQLSHVDVADPWHPPYGPNH